MCTRATIINFALPSIGPVDDEEEEVFAELEELITEGEGYQRLLDGQLPWETKFERRGPSDERKSKRNLEWTQMQKLGNPLVFLKEGMLY